MLGNTGAMGDGFSLNWGGNAAGDPLRAITWNAGTFALAATTSGYSVNTWHHGCAVFAAANSRTVYIDGGSAATETTSITPGSAPTSIAVGRFQSNAPSGYFSGRLAEVGVWSVGLNASEVAALARGISPRRVRPESLVGYWPIWGLHSPEIDLLGGVRPMTVTGATQANHAPVRPFTRMERAMLQPYDAASTFQAAWARGSNRLISGGVWGG